MYYYRRVRKTITGIIIGVIYFISSMFLVSMIGLKMFNSGTSELTIILLTIAQIFALRLIYRSIIAPAFVKYENR